FIGIIDLIIALAWLRASEDASYIITVTFIGLEMLFCAGFFLVLSYALNKAQKKLITT
ncbi:acid-resistance protein, partial [Klebsiella pneumoniae]